MCFYQATNFVFNEKVELSRARYSFISSIVKVSQFWFLNKARFLRQIIFIKLIHNQQVTQSFIILIGTFSI